MMRAFGRTLLLLASITCLVAFANAWSRPNDRSLDNIDPNAYCCGGPCQDVLSDAIQKDRTTIFGQIPFDDEFYATSSNFSPETSKPGDLLKLQRYINTVAYITSGVWDLPGGTNLYRIQYVSVGANNRSVPATAFVVLPFSKPKGERFNTIGYAHGTIGTFYGCATSTSFNLYDDDTWRPLLLAGYAVVATDYAGLGNNYTRHHWIANRLNANDVYYSVVAAKQAFPNLLSEEWVALGNSQGGGATWALVESEHAATDSAFLGSVALDPGVRFADLVSFFVERSADGPEYFAPFQHYSSFMYTVLETLKEGSGASLFTSAMVARNKMEEELGFCYGGEGALATGLSLDEIFTNASEVSTNDAFRFWQDEYGAGTGRRAEAPMLVVQSRASLIVPPQLLEKAWQTVCEAGGHSVKLSKYSSLDHKAVIGASAPEWLQWISDRFKGAANPESCSTEDHEALDEDAAYLPRDFDSSANTPFSLVREQVVYLPW